LSLLYFSLNLSMSMPAPAALGPDRTAAEGPAQARWSQGKSRGCFYRDGRGFLHFHEHGEDELYADIRIAGDEFDRLAVSTLAPNENLFCA
jgi:hypothetical protein